MKVTISDVAKKAGVSVATVSRVMNGNYPVKTETKEKVLKVIQELNFIPNVQARELTRQRSTAIGVVLPSINNMFFPEVVTNIEKTLKSKGYSLILCCFNNDKKEEIQCINDLMARNVAGIIVLDPTPANIKSKFYLRISRSIPIVFINGHLQVPNISYVSNDEEYGAEVALEYLFDNNHKNILFIRGEHSYSYDIKEKVYKRMLEAKNAFLPDNIINIGKGNGAETVDNTINKITEVLSKNRNITAIFACNDLMAVGAINACKRLGLNIPGDISIIGFDNIELSRIVEPKLSTIDQNMALLGLNAADLLLEKVENNNEYSKSIILNNKLVVRETVSKL